MFSRDHGFVFFLPMHPPRGPSPASLSSSAPHTAMDLGCFSATQHLPHCCWSCIHLHQSPLAWVIPRTLWPLPPCPYHTLHVLWRVQGPRPGCQRRRAPRDELHDCHFLNKFVLDMPPGSGSLLLWCHGWVGMHCLWAELSWVPTSPASNTVAGALCGTAAATGSP